MAKVRDLVFSFTPSGSPDVVSYKLYYGKATAGDIDYNSLSVDVGIPPIDPDTNKMVIDLVLLGVFIDEDIYHLGLVAVDDVGNESSMLKVMDVPFDLVAPDAPTDGEVIRI